MSDPNKPHKRDDDDSPGADEVGGAAASKKKDPNAKENPSSGSKPSIPDGSINKPGEGSGEQG